MVAIVLRQDMPAHEVDHAAAIQGGGLDEWTLPWIWAN
jgi:hypothetical protein